MKPYLLEEIDEFGAAFGRIVWGKTFDVEELHARHGAVLDLVADTMVLNVDDLGCNTPEEMKAIYSGLIAAALAQYERAGAELPDDSVAAEDDAP